MSKLNRKSIFAAAGGLAAAVVFAAMRHTAMAQQVGPAAAPVTPPATPAAPAPAVNPATALPPLSGPIGPAKVGVVNLGKIFANSKHLADARTALENQAKSDALIAAGKQEELKKLDAARKTMTVNTDAWRAATAEIQKRSLQAQMDDKLSQIALQHQQSEAVKAAYDEMAAAVAKVAAAKQLDLVLVDNGDELPPEAGEMAPDAVENMIQSHHVVYASKNIDITGDVAAQIELASKVPGH